MTRFKRQKILDLLGKQKSHEFHSNSFKEVALSNIRKNEYPKELCNIVDLVDSYLSSYYFINLNTLKTSTTYVSKYRNKI